MRKSSISTHRLIFLSKKVAILLLLLGCMEARCQNRKIDSLMSLLPIKSAAQEIDVFCELANEFADLDHRKSLDYAGRSLELAIQSKDSLRIVRAGRLKSYVYRRVNEMDSSIILSSAILPIARKNNYVTELTAILNGLAYATISKASYDKGLKYLFESLELKNSGGDKFEISVALHNIGVVYYKLDDTEKALDYYLRALHLKNQIENKYDLDILLVNIGLCYTEKKNFSEALKYIKEGFAKCGDGCSDNLLMQGSYGYGVIYQGVRDFFNAEQYFLESYKLSKIVGDERFQLDNIAALSEIYIQNNQISMAEKYLKEAEENVIQKSSPYNLELMEVYSQFFKVYEKTKNFEKISTYQNKYISIRDSVFNDELTRNLMKAEAEYQEKENNARIESQDKILALKEEVIYRQKVANASVGTVAGLVFILAVILARNNKQNRLRNKHLDAQVRERTKALEMNNDALQRAWQEHDVFISNSSSEIRSSIAKLQGLCSLASREIDHPLAGEYWKQLDNTSKELSAVLKKMLYSKTIENPMRRYTKSVREENVFLSAPQLRTEREQ